MTSDSAGYTLQAGLFETNFSAMYLLYLSNFWCSLLIIVTEKNQIISYHWCSTFPVCIFSILNKDSELIGIIFVWLYFLQLEMFQTGA